jgi:hypothetical protein
MVVAVAVKTTKRSLIMATIVPCAERFRKIWRGGSYITELRDF